MAKYFFPASLSAADAITDLYAFVWPTAAALWNMRWQVNGFLQVCPRATSAQLSSRFVAGSELEGGDLRRACVDTSWDDQKSRFASIILMNAFAIYETWSDEIASFGPSTLTSKRLQFPDAPALGVSGIGTALASLSAHQSPTMLSTYYPVFSGTDRYSGSIIPNLILAFRYFKEIRNAQTHAGGVASSRTEAAYNAFAPFSDRLSLGMNGDLKIDPVVCGSPVRLHLRGVVGFSDILLRMIATIDAELSKTTFAEAVLENYLRNSKYQPMTFSGNVERRREQVSTRCMRAGLPRPRNADAIYAFLRDRGLIHV